MMQQINDLQHFNIKFYYLVFELPTNIHSFQHLCICLLEQNTLKHKIVN